MKLNIDCELLKSETENKHQLKAVLYNRLAIPLLEVLYAEIEKINDKLTTGNEISLWIDVCIKNRIQ